MAASERRRRWLQFGVAVAISLVFTALFIDSIDLGQVTEALAKADYLYVLPAMALFAGSLVFRALRWRYFLLPDHDLTWRALMPSLLIGYAGNNLLPLRAGELVRAQHLADRFAIPRMQTFGALVMERLFDGFVLAAFVLWGLLVLSTGSSYLGVSLVVGGVTAAGFVLCLLVARDPRLPARLAGLPLPFCSAKRREQIAGLGESFLGGFSVLRSPSRFLLTGVATAGAWGLELAMYWLISRAFDLDASFLAVAFSGSAANVSLSLPSAQGGVGPFEVFATKALQQFGVAHSAAAAYALALHFFLIVPVSLVGLVVLWRSTLPGRARTAGVKQPALEAND